jgi:XTP/dITP diphosphohydrolase
MLTLLLATRNAHKVGEICAILGDKLRYLTLNDFPDAPQVVEDAGTFAGNAAKKAVELAHWLSQTGRAEGGSGNARTLVLADDSGLEVDALDGAPGVHSARFAALDSGQAGNSPDAENSAKLLRLLKDVPAAKRTARFRCVIALATVGGPQSAIHNPQLFSGACEGRIGFEPRGQNGFGYDPVFIPTSFAQTFAQLGDEMKNSLSHRAGALAKLKRHFGQLAGQ